MFLLDTDIVSNTRKAKPHPKLLGWLGTVPPDTLAISAMTVFELEAGISQLRAGGNAAKAEEISLWLDGLIASGSLPVLPIDHQVARLYGRMFATPGLKNFLWSAPESKQPKSGGDLILSATAIVHGAVIATNNARDFLAIHLHFPLPGIYLPFSDEWLIGGPPTT
ncbi:PIN domain-containing protein [Dongia sp.]|uniref:PIN domain-containing protein n=1 Tax=Dongia sp. TaxID=1977262 RepID=UPI0035ADA89B